MNKREEANEYFKKVKDYLNNIKKQVSLIEKLAENEYNKDIEKVKKMAGITEVKDKNG